MNAKLYFGMFLVVGYLLSFAWILYEGIFTFKAFDDFSPVVQVLFNWGIWGGLILWVWMLSNVFTNEGLKNRATWGWALILFNWLVIPVYFFLVYLPSELNGNKQRDI